MRLPWGLHHHLRVACAADAPDPLEALRLLLASTACVAAASTRDSGHGGTRATELLWSTLLPCGPKGCGASCIVSIDPRTVTVHSRWSTGSSACSCIATQLEA